MSPSESLGAVEGSAAGERRETPLRRPSLPAILTRLDAVATSPWFAYLSILLIQGKVLWGIWEYRDLTNGDTAAYYRRASIWSDHLGFDLDSASPAYSAFWGSLKWFITDVHAVSIAHRVIIVLAAAIVVLAVLRRLLPASIAWLLALWWVLQPINYDTVYEVHLFALLPTLVAVLVALHFRGLLMRAAVLTILIVSTVLVRNELAVAVAAWLGVWIAYEGWKLKQTRKPRFTWQLAWQLALPVATIALVLAVLLPRYVGSSGEIDSSASKGGEVFCQNFTYGARQRGDYTEPVTGNRPLHCRTLMERQFHQPLPSFSTAFRENPGAVLEHVGWNAKLIPQGLELMLFSQISGSQQVNPDVVAVTDESPIAFVGLVIVGLVIVVGTALLWRERKRWWEDWLRERAWGYAVLGCLALAALVVMLAIRPRPSYLFNLSVLLLVLVGTSVMVIGSRWPGLRSLRATVPLLAAAIVIVVPSLYNADYETPQAGLGRPLLQMVDRLKPHAELLAGPETHFLAPQFAADACIYVEPLRCEGRSFSLLQPLFSRAKGKTLPGAIKQRGISLLYADDLVIANPATRQFLERLQRKGWESLGPPVSYGDWVLLRAPAEGSSRSPTKPPTAS